MTELGIFITFWMSMVALGSVCVFCFCSARKYYLEDLKKGLDKS